LSAFAWHPTSIAGLGVIDRRRHEDPRGWFSKLFCAEELAEVGWRGPVCQVNHSHTSRIGTVRGLHFQRAPHGEMKLVTCIRGAIWDVAVDLREDSPTRWSWHAEELSAANGRALLIPEGFAHGFQVLRAESELIYLHSAPYVPNAEDGVHPGDPKLAISWPMAVSGLSSRDASLPYLGLPGRGST
jgi:dTDP-4-dehydrorhamnose 3,5-epimerase